MTGQDSVGGDERVAQLIRAARELIDAYERKSTANEHFLKLEAAVNALGGTSGQTPAGQDRANQDPAPRRPSRSGPGTGSFLCQCRAGWCTSWT